MACGPDASCHGSFSVKLGFLCAKGGPTTVPAMTAATLNSFSPLKNDLVLRAAKGLPTERVPVWLMRQAGRYLPEFKALRAENDFFKVCETPELACEITLQPIRRYPLDAAIIFSDILTLPKAMGLEVQMVPGVGPHFPDPLNTPEDLLRLHARVDVHVSLQYVFDAITLTRHRLDGHVPLVGFSGAPWTLMAYMVEGGGSRTFEKAKTWLFRYPQESHGLLSRITAVIVDYLFGQIQAGAQMLQVFDSWAGELAPTQFDEFCLPYLSRIADSVNARCTAQGTETVPLILFAKGAHYALEKLANTSYDVIGLDWTIEPEQARQLVGTKSLQGNLDPCALFGDRDTIRRETKAMLRKFGTQRYIANLGHGMSPSHSPESAGHYIEAVRDFSLEMNAGE